MFVGHGLLAFALAAALASMAGVSRERALAVGLLAAGFGLAPDVDVLYAPVGLVGASGLLEAETAFWSTGNLVHRAVTHSLVVGTAAALAAALWSRRTRPARAAAVAVGGGIVALAVPDGVLPAAILAAFVLAVFALATAGRRNGIAPHHVGGAALLGLLSHPFGDLFTGEPPVLLYPLDVPVLAERVVLHPDPTLHLVGAFGVELATAWLAALVYLRLEDRRLADYVAPHATLGIGFAAAALVLPPPSLETPYRFVFGALGVGMVSAVGVRPRVWRAMGTPRARPRTLLGAGLTGLTTLSVALLAYAVLYVRL